MLVSVLYIFVIFLATVCSGVFIRKKKKESNQLYQLASKGLKVPLRDQLGKSVPQYTPDTEKYVVC